MGYFRTTERLRSTKLKASYDAVIVGGGVHGAATAYYLARRGISNVAVLEADYIGSGASGRNTSQVRANYRAIDAIPFYSRSLEMYRGLSGELGFNILNASRGDIELAHTHDSVRVERERALVNQAFGVDTHFLSSDEVVRLCPAIDVSGGGKYPVLGASYHPPATLPRHDAVVWGYVIAAQRLGADVHQSTRVTEIVTTGDQCRGVNTDRGFIATDTVVCAAGGYVSAICRQAGLDLPIVTKPLQAFVTLPYKPIFDFMIASTDLLVYVAQTTRGEILLGAETLPYSSFSTRATPEFVRDSAARALLFLPCLANCILLRQWAGLCDMSPDYSPIIGTSPIGGLFLSTGWGTWGFKAAPAAGSALADLIVDSRVPDLIAAFGLSRFWNDRLVPDRASAGTE